jgi:hypothetical protein
VADYGKENQGLSGSGRRWGSKGCVLMLEGTVDDGIYEVKEALLFTFQI